MASREPVINIFAGGKHFVDINAKMYFGITQIIHNYYGGTCPFYLKTFDEYRNALGAARQKAIN